mmetsp:Transcript_23481/g.93080  ORF Transcript_23481/g.93080 Transcript_23481/m.93080 type:complete len:208 (+) Transcript_23481:60-683(+)
MPLRSAPSARVRRRSVRRADASGARWASLPRVVLLGVLLVVAHHRAHALVPTTTQTTSACLRADARAASRSFQAADPPRALLRHSAADRSRRHGSARGAVADPKMAAAAAEAPVIQVGSTVRVTAEGVTLWHSPKHKTGLDPHGLVGTVERIATVPRDGAPTPISANYEIFVKFKSPRLLAHFGLDELEVVVVPGDDEAEPRPATSD